LLELDDKMNAMFEIKIENVCITSPFSNY